MTSRISFCNNKMYYVAPNPYREIAAEFFEKSKKNETIEFGYFVEKATAVNSTNGTNHLLMEFLQSPFVTVDNIKSIIEHGADPKYANDKPLQQAIYFYPDIALYLINEHQATLNTDCLDFILRCKQKINIRIWKALFDNGLVIPKEKLSYFMAMNDISMVKLLIDQGYELADLFNEYCEYLFKNNSQVIYYPNGYLINEIIKNSHLITFDQRILDNITYALEKHYEDSSTGDLVVTLENIQFLVQIGINPRLGNDHLLIISASNNDLKCIDYLVNVCGLDVNTSKSQALIIALSLGSWEIVTFLLDSRIKITDECILYVIREDFYVQTVSPATSSADMNAGHAGQFIDPVVSRCKQNYIDLMIKYGINVEHIAQMYINDRSIDPALIKTFINHGIDMNQILLKSSPNKI